MNHTDDTPPWRALSAGLAWVAITYALERGGPYLVPAALWSIANDAKVVVSTHTKALQGQLLASDLPVLTQAGLAVRGPGYQPQRSRTWTQRP